MNDILFGNNNRAIIKKIAKNHSRANGRRNLFIILAVILTTVLFAAFFTIGGGFIDQIKQTEQRQYGTAHAAVKFLSQDQYDALVKSSMKKEISYTRLVGTAVNEELSRLATEVRFAKEGSARSFLCYPTTGGLPLKENEIAASTLVLDALGVPYELGTTVQLSVSVDGILWEKDFVLCGFWEGYPLASAQEVWVSQLFADAIAPASNQEYEKTGKYGGLYCADISFDNGWDLRTQLDILLADAEIVNASDSINPTFGLDFLQGKADISFLIAIVVLLGTILLAGYLIIYNLFYISVTQDVRFWGMLRTIGASGRQLKAIMRKQVFGLAMVSLPFGLIIGYLVGHLLLPFVLTQVNVTDTGIYRINPLVLIGAALFALLTVYISSLKPCRYAAKIPAIEAIRYSENESGIKTVSTKIKKTTTFSMAIANLKRSRKKALLVILSLSLSLILLNITYTAISGFDVDTFIAKSAVADFYLTDYSIRTYGGSNKNLSGISNQCLVEIDKLPGLENSASIYASEIRQPIPNDMVTRFEEMNGSSRTLTEEQFITEKYTSALVYGVDDSLNDKITLTHGEWDGDRWATGNYVIVSDFYYQGTMGEGQSPFYQIGDMITLEGKNSPAHTYTVMGIGTLNYNLDAQYTTDFGLTILMPKKDYSLVYGDTQPLCTIFNVDDSNTENAENWISNYCENEENNLTYISRRVYEQEFERDKITYTMVGGILVLILALIGLLNFVNAAATSIITRQKELAMLGAIGMSRRQLKEMLIYESLSYVVLAFLVTATIGTGICYFVCTNLVSNIWAFVYRFTLTPVLVCMPILLAIAVMIPLVFNRQISKKSIIERLRISE